MDGDKGDGGGRPPEEGNYNRRRAAPTLYLL